MGYQTYFEGEFEVSPTLKPEHREYLRAFGYVRHVRRNEKLTEQLYPDTRREAVGLPIGPDGLYYVGSADDGAFGQGDWDSEAVIDGNSSGLAPGLWCHWVPDEAGERIAWDGGEKFYDYLEWIAFLVRHFLSPWGYRLNGQVTWQGEEPGDRGIIFARDNVLTYANAIESYGDEVPI